MDIDLKEYLLSHSLEGIFITDFEGNILQYNNTAQQILSHKGNLLNGQHISFVFPPKSITHLLPNLLHLARSSGGFNGDILLQDSRGDEVFVRMFAQVWPEPDPSLLLFRFLDWRETHLIMEQLRQSTQLASLGTLTRSLSHEILNPVSVIGGHTRRLLDSMESGTKEEEWARQILDSVEKLESMIETLRNFLTLPTPSFEKKSLDDLLKSSLDQIREDASKLGIQVSETRTRKTREIFMDPHLLEKAFSAVFLNALDRMPNGGELTLDTDSSKSHCHVSIGDSGPALDAWQIEEDLSPIHIIGAHRTHLNLAIAKRIVDEHGGNFDLGKPGMDGMKIKISLPLDRRALAREREM